jgi:hypothetical protein
MTLLAGKRPGRNEPCHCGSGRKYKQCCLAKDEVEAAAARAKAAEAQATEASSEKTETTTSAAPVRPPKHQTQQPWKATTSRGYIPKTRTPRKIGS